MDFICFRSLCIAKHSLLVHASIDSTQNKLVTSVLLDLVSEQVYWRDPKSRENREGVLVLNATLSQPECGFCIQIGSGMNRFLYLRMKQSLYTVSVNRNL